MLDSQTFPTRLPTRQDGLQNRDKVYHILHVLDSQQVAQT